MIKLGKEVFAAAFQKQWDWVFRKLKFIRENPD
jgi:hypothetical protein